MPNTNYNKMYESDKEPVAMNVTSIETVDASEVAKLVSQPEPEVVEPVVTEPEQPTASVIEKTEPETRKAIVCNCKKLNVRENPKPKANVIMIINEDDEITVYTDGSVGNYYSIRTESGVEGYCVKDYLKMK